jgi:predicted permease
MSTEGAGSHRLRQLLVASQVALSVVLLIGAGLLIRGVYDLQKVDPGFDPDQLVTLRTEFPGFRYEGPEEVDNITTELLARSRALPGVKDVALADSLPFQGGLYNNVYRPENPPEIPSDACPATRRVVSDGFFRTLGVPVLTGRGFHSGDRLDGTPVTVISRALSEALFPDENPLGKIIVLPWGDGIHLEVVGVAGDVRDFGLGVDIMPVFYLPKTQYPRTSLTMVARVGGDPGSLVPLLREEVRAVEKDAPVTGVVTMQELIDDSTADSDFVALLLGTFAAIALALAATGLYGAVAHFVADRRREIGIRVALGASPPAVAFWVLRRAVQMAGAGLLAGLLLALLLSRTLKAGLLATASPDPATFFAVGGVLMAATVLACAVPTARALSSDSAATLREE